MASEKKNPLGPTGQHVRENVRRLRDQKKLTYAELSRRLDDVGRPIATLGLSRIENGARRVDSDDLVALALALGVSPATLLMPHIDSISEWRIGKIPVTDTVSANPETLWDWMIASSPLIEPPEGNERAVLGFQLDAQPPHAVIMDNYGTSRRAKRAEADRGDN